MIKKIIKLITGILFLPFCIGISRALYDSLGLLILGQRHQFYFFLGIITYVLMHLLVWKPDYLYVFAHELVHAFFAILFGGKIKSFKVSSSGGSVSTTKSNFIISLAPYIFPLYTLVVSLVFFIMCFFWEKAYNYTNIYIFCAGFFLALHFIMTADSLKTKQTDITENGYLFSLTLIYFVNVLILLAPLSGLFENVSFKILIKETWYYSKEVFVFLWFYIQKWADKLYGLIQN